MAETRTPIRDVRSVLLDGSGNGTVQFGPGRPNTRWVITGVSVSVETNTLESRGDLYRGGALVSSTFTGSSGDSDNELPDYPLWPGEQYVFTWTAGDPAARATLAFRGEEITGV
jgi:hypothetical protein